MSKTDEAKNAISQLPRENMQSILESYGFGVYDSEPTEALREAVLKEFLAGGIEVSDIYREPPKFPGPRDR